MAQTFCSYGASMRISTDGGTTLGILKQPQMVSIRCSAAKFSGLPTVFRTTASVIPTVVTTAASMAETAMLARSLVRKYLPEEVQSSISCGFRSYVSRRFLLYFSTQMTITIEAFEGIVHNEVFEAAKAYLATKISPSNKKIKVSKDKKERSYNVTVDGDEEVVDTFNGVQFRWVLRRCHVESTNRNSKVRSEIQSFELNFHKQFKDMALGSYLPFMVKRATLMKQEKEKLKMFTLYTGSFFNRWTSVTLDHPSTFKTLAMDSDVKRSVMEDLDKFVKRSDYYKRVGRAWKRGYLLYGPPGTGKSSLIAAMANHLHFDIYDLELTAVSDNSELRRLLIATANRSILVVEDIDCSIKLNNRTADDEPTERSRNKQVTLSGLLNFIDGLWSSCGEERIIIFTTNYKEKLDPALLRPGRMDMHIHMSYCTPSTFKVLASNYLEIEEHRLFSKIEEGIEATEVTPAEVAEQLMRNDTVDKILEGLIEFLKVKKIKNEQAKAIKEKQELENKEKTTTGKDSVVKKTEDQVDDQAKAKKKKQRVENKETTTKKKRKG